MPRTPQRRRVSAARVGSSEVRVRVRVRVRGSGLQELLS